MGQVLVLTSGKGGVGKTTMAANLAYSLALQNQKVTLVDLDVGLRNLDIIMGIEHKVVYHIGDVLEGVCQLRQALIKDKRVNNLSFLPGMLQQDKEINLKDVRELIARLKSDNDYVVVDGPAGLEQGFRMVISVADEVLIVVNPEMCSVRDSNQVMDYIYKNCNLPMRLIVNRTRKTFLFKNHFLNTRDIEEMLMLPVLGEIPNDEHLICYINKGEIMALSNNPIGTAVYQLGERIIKESGAYEIC